MRPSGKVARFIASLSSDARAQFEARFWLKVDRFGGPDACWPWLAKINKHGYGMFTARHGLQITAHAVSSMLVDGIGSGVDVFCHSCDTRYAVGDASYRKCCNPTHVWRGTNAANMADMAAKGRASQGDAHWSRLYPERRATGDRNGMRTHPEAHSRGEDHYLHQHPERVWGELNPRAKLTEDQVRLIRRRATTTPMLWLAREYGVAFSTMRSLVKMETWKHVRD